MTFHTGNFYLSTSQMQDNAKYVYSYLSARGWSNNAIYAMLGNFQAESKINPGIWQSLREGNVSGGYGLVQWTPATKFLEWCDTFGHDPEHMDSALKRIEYELENGLQWIKTSAYPLTFAEFKTSTKSPEYLALAFVKNYERPASSNQTHRSTYARNWANYLADYAGEPIKTHKKSMSLLLLYVGSKRG